MRGRPHLPTQGYIESSPSESVTDHTEEVVTETIESNDSSEFGATISHACENSLLPGHVDEQAT